MNIIRRILNNITDLPRGAYYGAKIAHGVTLRGVKDAELLRWIAKGYREELQAALDSENITKLWKVFQDIFFDYDIDQHGKKWMKEYKKRKATKRRSSSLSNLRRVQSMIKKTQTSTRKKSASRKRSSKRKRSASKRKISSRNASGRDR